MLNFLYVIFIKYAALVPLCVMAGEHVLRWRIPKFPNGLIPLTNLIASILLLVFWAPLIRSHWPLGLRIFNGILYGFAVTGIHQFFRQTRDYIRLRKLRKQMKKNIKENQSI